MNREQDPELINNGLRQAYDLTRGISNEQFT